MDEKIPTEVRAHLIACRDAHRAAVANFAAYYTALHRGDTEGARPHEEARTTLRLAEDRAWDQFRAALRVWAP